MNGPPMRERPWSMGNAMLDSAATSVAVTLLTLVTGIALARLLGPDGRGQYGAVLFWGQFAGNFFTFSLYEALVVRLRARAEPPEGAVSLALLILAGIVGFTALAAFGAIAAGALDMPGFGSAMLVGFVLPIAAAAFANRAFATIETAGLSFRRLNMERVISPSLFLAGAICLYATGKASVAAVLVLFIAARLPLLILRIIRYRHHLLGKIDRGLAQEVFRLAPKLFLATGAMTIAQQIDRVIVTSLWPAEWLGYYFVAFSAAGAGLALASQAIRITLLPSLAGLAPAECRDKVERLMRLSLVTALGVTIPIFILAPVLVPLVYGAEFAPAAYYVRCIAVAMAFLPTLQIVNIANRAGERGRPGVEMGLAMAAAYGIGYLITGFAQPVALFATMACANLAGIAAGLRHLARNGAARIGPTLVPGPADVLFLARSMSRYAGGIVKKTVARFDRSGR